MGLVYRILPSLGYRAPQGRLASFSPGCTRAGS